MAAKPRPKLCADEGFNSFAAGEPPPELAAFTLQANLYIEERAASPLQRREFRQGLIVGAVWHKFKFVTVTQLLYSQQCRMQEFAQLLLAMPLLRAKRRAITKERTLSFSRGLCAGLGHGTPQ